jgi:hypothetical protein
MFLENPDFDEVAELLDRFEGKAVEVEVVSAHHAPLVSLVGILKCVGARRILIYAGDDRDRPSILRFDAACLSLGLPRMSRFYTCSSAIASSMWTTPRGSSRSPSNSGGSLGEGPIRGNVSPVEREV